jgi:hypothetical protein
VISEWIKPKRKHEDGFTNLISNKDMFMHFINILKMTNSVGLYFMMEDNIYDNIQDAEDFIVDIFMNFIIVITNHG